MPITAYRVATAITQADCLVNPVGAPIRPWNNLAGVLSGGGLFAFSDHAASDTDLQQDVSRCLIATDFGFDTLGIPAGDVVLGIQFRALIRQNRSDPGFNIRDWAMRAVIAGAETGQNVARTTVTNWPTGAGFSLISWGNVLLNYNWSGAPPVFSSLVDATFGWALAVTGIPGLKLPGPATAQAQVDRMDMRIRHEPPQGRRRSTMVSA